MENPHHNHPNPVFVFGSNLAGIHGAGAAKHALRYWGAIYGQGVGLQGRSYAIPTKDAAIKTLTLTDIDGYVSDFIDFATDNHDMTFLLTKIGCGLANLANEDIAIMFRSAPPNVILIDESGDSLCAASDWYQNYTENPSAYKARIVL